MDRTEFESRYITARRLIITQDFADLNDMQLEAVKITQGPLLLLAGAGSGKTTVLVSRIANLLKYGCGSDSEYVPVNAKVDDLAILEEYVGSHFCSAPDQPESSPIAPDIKPLVLPCHPPPEIAELCAVEPVEPWRIIAITFTNKAAGEMKTRLERMLGTAARDIWAMTFHSACVKILRRDIDRLGYDKDFAIYDTSDSASLMKRILKDLDIDDRVMPHKTVLSQISRAKDSRMFAGDFLASAEKQADPRRKIVGRAYLEYETRLKSSNALDFDDLILLTVTLFYKHPDVLQHYQQRFKHVLVDEYQDTNNLQYLLASALAGGYGNICVVGDDDQSIYKFRGATIENILSFEKRFDDAYVIRLEQNYRSSGYILNAANEVIRNNKGRKGKKLWTENSPGDKPSLHITSDERDEAQFVADEIISGTSQGRDFKDHAVLYRMNAQSNQFETAFKRNGIPYRIYGGTGFYDRAEIKDMLAYLCVIHNPNDDVRLLRIINNPARGIGDTTIGKLMEIAAEKSLSIYEAIRSSQDYDSLKSSAGRLHIFADMIDELRGIEAAQPLDQLYDDLLRLTGYIRALEEKGNDENIARIENVMELKTNIIGFINENGGSLFDFLSETALFTDLDRDDGSKDRVLLMTMHSAKGLEFDSVFIVGAEEGLFPGIRSIGEPEEMEEERRLCYVAMTRAMRRLYFTCTQRRMLFGKTSSSQPSRFIGEISTDNIDIHDAPDSFAGSGFDSDYGFNRYAIPRTPGAPSQSLYSEPFTVRVSTHNKTPPSSGSHRSSLASFASPVPQLQKGDTVDHSAFGRGTVISVSPIGKDALLEIAFESDGTRRMLINTAARYITKV